MKSSRSYVAHGAVVPMQFHSREPDNLLRVEQTGAGGVVVCAAKPNFDPVQRRNFVLYLKAEGFIPGETRLIAGDGRAGAMSAEGRISWVLDPCWPYREVGFNYYSRRLCARLLLGSGLVWLLLMGLVALLTEVC